MSVAFYGGLLLLPGRNVAVNPAHVTDVFVFGNEVVIRLGSDRHSWHYPNHDDAIWAFAEIAETLGITPPCGQVA